MLDNFFVTTKERRKKGIENDTWSCCTLHMLECCSEPKRWTFLGITIRLRCRHRVCGPFSRRESRDRYSLLNCRSKIITANGSHAPGRTAWTREDFQVRALEMFSVPSPLISSSFSDLLPLFFLIYPGPNALRREKVLDIKCYSQHEVNIFWATCETSFYFFFILIFSSFNGCSYDP